MISKYLPAPRPCRRTNGVVLSTCVALLSSFTFTGCEQKKPISKAPSKEETPAAPTAPSTPAAPTAPSKPATPPASSKRAERPVSERDQAILAAIDTTRPGLEKVKAALATGDLLAARHELAAYYRSRKSPTWRTQSGRDTSVRFNKKYADDASQGILMGTLVKVEYTFPNGNIDWMFDATKNNPNPKIAYNKEWQVQNNRMYFWQEMAKAYRATGDEKYAKAFVSQMNDWIADCPLPTEKKNAAPSTWRTIEAGLRMANAWPDSFYSFLQSPSFTDADIVNFLGAIKDHATYLRQFHTDANWLTMEMAGLYTCGAIFPEFRDAKQWRDFSAGLLATEVDRQFMADGGHVELTGGYHVVAINNFLAITEAALCGGFEKELPPSYVAGIEKAYDYILSLRTPDNNIPCFNDSWPLDSHNIYTKAVKFYPTRTEFKWALSDGKEGTPPKYTSKFLNRNGFAVMRSDWTTQANYLVFDVGPLGYGHVHQDKLNLVLWAFGRELLFDGGGASYEVSKWRDWSLSTASHNTVLVDGLNQNIPLEPNADKRYKDPACVAQSDIDAGWISNERFDYATSTYASGQGPARAKIATHQRQVLFLKPDIYLVVDKLSPNDTAAHSYQARWHLMSTKTMQNPATKEIVTADPGLANLAIIPLATEGLAVTSASAQETPEILGWNIRKDQSPMITPATTVLHTVNGRGEKQFVTLLLPLMPGATSPIQSISPGKTPVVTLKDGRRLKIQTVGGLSIEEVLPNGKVSRSAKRP